MTCYGGPIILLHMVIGKRRRQVRDFPGADVIVPQIKAKTQRKRVGLMSSGPPVRQHTPILSLDGKVIGNANAQTPNNSGSHLFQYSSGTITSI